MEVRPTEGLVSSYGRNPWEEAMVSRTKLETIVSAFVLFRVRPSAHSYAACVYPCRSPEDASLLPLVTIFLSREASQRARKWQR